MFLRCLSRLLSRLPPDFYTILDEMTDADKRMNPLHLGSDLADIRIQINSEIPISISYHFRLRF